LHIVRTCGLVGTKRQLHVEPDADDDSHRFDKINFSHPKTSTKALRTILHDSPSASAKHDLEADVPTIFVETQTSNVTKSVHHVTGVQESDCDVHQWHIRRVPSVEKNVCFAMQTRTGRICIQNLPLSIPAPAYFGVLYVRSKNKDFEHLFYFCPDDIARCVKGIRRKWIKSRPDVHDVWPIQRGTNLNAREIMTLEQAGFQLQQRQHTHKNDFLVITRPLLHKFETFPNRLILKSTSFTGMAEPLVAT
jgi:hypothetical protein